MNKWRLGERAHLNKRMGWENGGHNAGNQRRAGRRHWRSANAPQCRYWFATTASSQGVSCQDGVDKQRPAGGDGSEVVCCRGGGRRNSTAAANSPRCS